MPIVMDLKNTLMGMYLLISIPGMETHILDEDF